MEFSVEKIMVWMREIIGGRINERGTKVFTSKGWKWLMVMESRWIKKRYTIKSIYRIFFHGSRVDDNDLFDKLWKCIVTSDQHFSWRAFINRVATKDNLTRRGIIVENIMCLVCGIKEESVSHLFFIL